MCSSAFSSVFHVTYEEESEQVAWSLSGCVLLAVNNLVRRSLKTALRSEGPTLEKVLRPGVQSFAAELCRPSGCLKGENLQKSPFEYIHTHRTYIHTYNQSSLDTAFFITLETM